MKIGQRRSNGLGAISVESLRIDTIRGLACLLLVGWHVAGDDATNGLHIGQGSLRNFADAMTLIRMPLFTFLSGLVYAYRPYSGDLGGFVGGKVRRLLIPLLTIGTAFAVIHALAAHRSLSSINWLTLHVNPIGQYWFIQSLFLVFLVIVLLESLALLATFGRASTVLIIALGISNMNMQVHEFGVHGLFYLTPFFVAGLIYQRFSLREKISSPAGIAALAALALIIAAHTAIGLQLPEAGTWLSSWIGLVGCAGLMTLDLRSRTLAWVGYYSYSIYLLHVFFTSPARSIVEKAGFSGLPVMFASGLLAGILGPIVLDRLLGRHRLPTMLLLGKSEQTQRPSTSAQVSPKRG